jgi:hypothetical protein
MDHANQIYSISPIFKDFFNLLNEQALYALSPLVKTDPLIIYNKAIEDILKLMSAKIDKYGNLQFVPEGCIWRYIKSEDDRGKLINILSEGIGIQLSYHNLKGKFLNAILNEKQSNEELEEFLDCYAYDLFSGIQQSFLNVQAECAGLNKFVYSGNIIRGSRDFCKEKVNKVFTREDIKQWGGQDWKGKNCNVPFEISRGGYNCRHTLMWIPDEAAEYFRI